MIFAVLAYVVIVGIGGSLAWFYFMRDPCSKGNADTNPSKQPKGYTNSDVNRIQSSYTTPYPKSSEGNCSNTSAPKPRSLNSNSESMVNKMRCPHCKSNSNHKLLRECSTTTDYKCTSCGNAFFIRNNSSSNTTSINKVVGNIDASSTYAVESIFNQARVLENKMEFDDAVKLYNEILTKYPTTETAKYAKIYRDKINDKNAIKNIKTSFTSVFKRLYTTSTAKKDFQSFVSPYANQKQQLSHDKFIDILMYTIGHELKRVDFLEACYFVVTSESAVKIPDTFNKTDLNKYINDQLTKGGQESIAEYIGYADKFIGNTTFSNRAEKENSLLITAATLNIQYQIQITFIDNMRHMDNIYLSTIFNSDSNITKKLFSKESLAYASEIIN